MSLCRCRTESVMLECSMCHVPYNEAVLPFPVQLSCCAICRSVSQLMTVCHSHNDANGFKCRNVFVDIDINEFINLSFYGVQAVVFDHFCRSTNVN